MTHVYRASPISFMEFYTWTNLLIFDMASFDIILGMTWLSLNYFVFICNTKSVNIKISGRETLEWEGVYKAKES